MTDRQTKDLLHGVTLEQILNALVADYGWEKLGKYIKIKCFTTNPTVKSSLKLLRRTPWARTKVENLYISMKKREIRKSGDVWKSAKHN
ncbi:MULTISPECIES: VF530 family DNA-binding protein [Desulfosediminicola]|uniref:VF530 family protein n=1 Tax=Desulfosediminicola TaxID=2886823 RepID=UPI0010AC0F77|nr:VF530 family protein [Desulfosediminicola ganghwensis]